MMNTFEPGDVSLLVCFHFFQSVYYLKDASEKSFPGKFKELCGHWIEVAESIGTLITYKILTDGRKPIFKSLVCPANNTATQNLCEDPYCVEPVPLIPDLMYKHLFFSCSSLISDVGDNDEHSILSTAPVPSDNLDL